MGKFTGILICTDLDGTAYKNDKTLSCENKKAIEYFKAEGGYFTFVTGRMPYTSLEACALIEPNVPAGTINGGALYDFSKNEYIWKTKADRSIMELVACVDKELPGVGIQVNTFEELYFSKDNAAMQYFRKVTGAPNLVRHYRDVDEDIAKVVFGIDTEEELVRICELMEQHPLAGNFDFVRSERRLYEILPKGISKAVGLEKLCEYLGVSIDKSVSVGDFYNDIPMIKAAGTGIAVGNACREAKDAADFVTSTNEEDAIAKVIYGIEQGRFNI